MDSVGEIPVVAVCETPFAGLDGVIKRATEMARPRTDAIWVVIEDVELTEAEKKLLLALTSAPSREGPLIRPSATFSPRGGEKGHGGDATSRSRR